MPQKHHVVVFPVASIDELVMFVDEHLNFCNVVESSFFESLTVDQVEHKVAALPG